MPALSGSPHIRIRILSASSEHLSAASTTFSSIVQAQNSLLRPSSIKRRVKARIDAHLDAGCDVVLVCHPDLVDESLAAVEGRPLNTAALLGLIGRGAMGWDGLIAGSRATAPRSRGCRATSRELAGRPAGALAIAEQVHDRATIERAIARMAVRIRNDYAGDVPVYLTVMHGGLPFAGAAGAGTRCARPGPRIRLPARHALSRRDLRRRPALEAPARDAASRAPRVAGRRHRRRRPHAAAVRDWCIAAKARATCASPRSQ